MLQGLELVLFPPCPAIWPLNIKELKKKGINNRWGHCPISQWIRSTDRNSGPNESNGDMANYTRKEKVNIRNHCRRDRANGKICRVDESPAVSTTHHNAKTKWAEHGGRRSPHKPSKREKKERESLNMAGEQNHVYIGLRKLHAAGGGIQDSAHLPARSWAQRCVDRICLQTGRQRLAKQIEIDDTCNEFHAPALPTRSAARKAAGWSTHPTTSRSPDRTTSGSRQEDAFVGNLDSGT